MSRRPVFHQVSAYNAALLGQFLAFKRELVRLSANTLDIYSRDLGSYLETLGSKPATRASVADMNAWLLRPRYTGSGQAAPVTLKREITTLRSFYRWAVEQAEVMATNPALKLIAPKVHNENPRPVAQSTWRRLWSSDLTDDERVALGLAYYCGLRRHEVTLLAPWQFTEDRRIVKVRRKGAKHSTIYWGTSLDWHERTLPHLLPGGVDSFELPLKRLLAKRSDEPLLLPWDSAEIRARYASRTTFERPPGVTDPMAFNRKLRLLLDRVGVQHITPHQCRHSYVTNLLAGGIPLQTVSRLAGHASVQVTLRYAEAVEDPLRAFMPRESGDPDENDGPPMHAPRMSPW